MVPIAAQAPKTSAVKPTAVAPPVSVPPDGGWPRRFETADGATLLLYQPQIDSWDRQTDRECPECGPGPDELARQLPAAVLAAAGRLLAAMEAAAAAAGAADAGAEPVFRSDRRTRSATVITRNRTAGASLARVASVLS